MFRRSLSLFSVIVFIFQTSLIYAGETLSLEPLIQEVKQNNPDLLAAKKRYEAAKARIPQAKSLDDPVLEFKFEKAKGSPFQLSKTMSEDRMLELSQMLPWFGRLPLKGKIALVESQMLAVEYKDKELEVVSELKNAYYDLFMNYKEVELSQESLMFLENIAHIAEAGYVVGELLQEDLFKINLEIAKLSNDIANLKQKRQAQEVRLNTLLNRQANTSLGMPQLGEDFSFQEEIDSLYRLTLENQPTLLVFQYAIERNKYAKSLAQKSFFPDLMAKIAMRGFTTGTIGPWDLMLAFSVPIWFWSKQRYEIKEAIANLQEAEAAYQAMKNKALAQTKELFSKIEIAKNKIILYKNTQAPLLDASIQSSLSAYKSGKGDIMLLLDSQRMLIETKMSYYQALVEYNMNLADLERTIGIDLREVKK